MRKQYKISGRYNTKVIISKEGPDFLMRIVSPLFHESTYLTRTGLRKLIRQLVRLRNAQT